MEQQIQICDSILEKIHKILEIPHNRVLDEELTKFLVVFQKIKNTTYDSFVEFKEFIRQNTSKVFHFDHYTNLPTPILIILHIFLSELNLLYDYINYYNSININYTEPYKQVWKKIIDGKYTSLCNNFGNNLPCMEGFIDDLLKELESIKTEPTKPEDIEIKLILSKEDFKNDGGFKKRVSESMQDWQIVGLTLSTFRVALCGTYNNCEIDNKLIRQSFNMINYDTYLDYIDFYIKNPRITKSFVSDIIESAGGIDNRDDSIPKGKFCCIPELIDGGKQTRKNKRNKINKRNKKNKKSKKNKKY